jgi:hypothetical protein
VPIQFPENEWLDSNFYSSLENLRPKRIRLEEIEYEVIAIVDERYFEEVTISILRILFHNSYILNNIGQAKQISNCMG